MIDDPVLLAAAKLGNHQERIERRLEVLILDPRAGGKTNLEMLRVLNHLRAGGKVVMIDPEHGEIDVGQRLSEALLADSPEVINERTRILLMDEAAARSLAKSIANDFAKCLQPIKERREDSKPWFHRHAKGRRSKY